MNTSHWAGIVSESKKRFWLLRHGESLANESGKIVSRGENGEAQFGLTERGGRQVRDSVKSARDNGHFRDQVAVFTSPFLRTRQTAEIVAELLGSRIVVDERLRERDFGELELCSDENYAQVWSEDARGCTRSSWGAESVYDVLRRGTGLVSELEDSVDAGDVLLTTHCDVAMILLCAARRDDPRWHRRLPPMRPAELRKLLEATTAAEP